MEKTLGEMLYENSPEMLSDLNIRENKKSRITAAQFAAKAAIANTPHSLRLNTNIADPAKKVKHFLHQCIKARQKKK